MTGLDEVYFNIEWPRNRPVQLVGLGLNSVDWICILPHFPEHDTKIQVESLHKVGGGPVATASALCARYGLKVRYLGRVGDDEMGQFSLQDLEKEPMDVSGLEVIKGASSLLSIIIVDRPTGERTILWDRDPTLHYKAGDLKEESIAEGQLLHLDGYDQSACIQAARYARKAGMKVSLDIEQVRPGVEELLALADFVIPNLNFVREFSAKQDWKEGLLTLSGMTEGCIAVTLGKQGAAAVWEGRILEIPGLTIKPVDTTGAGDVFHGAFLYALFQAWSLGQCLRFANLAAALSCTRYGSRSSIPSLQEVMAQVWSLPE